MSALSSCQKCGSPNPLGARFCSNCGTVLTGGVQSEPPRTLQEIPVYPGMVPTQPMDYALALMPSERRTSINRTRTGIVLLIIGQVMAIIPAISILAGFAFVAGAILIFIGRKVFSKTHQSYVTRSIVLLVLGVLAGSGVIAWSIILANTIQLPLVSIYTTVAVALLVANGVLGLGLVLFTYALQSQRGKLLLWLGYVSTLVLTVLVYSVFISQAQSGNPPTSDEMLISRLLLGTPAIPYAIAYYFGLSNLEKKLIPETISPPPQSSIPPQKTIQASQAPQTFQNIACQQFEVEIQTWLRTTFGSDSPLNIDFREFASL